MNKDKKPLSETHPELAKEAHGWDPSLISAGSDQKLNWKCQKNHHWKAAVYSRKVGGGCPVCSNRKLLTGFNDIATTHPDLAKEAHGWDPTKTMAGTSKKLTWKCSIGHVWHVSGNSRVNYNTRCPFCNNSKVFSGFNDLATTHPDLAKEAHGWDPTKVMTESHKKLEWICSKQHLWISEVRGRVFGNGCPVCSNRKLLTGFNDIATTHPDLAKEAHGWDPTKTMAGTSKKLTWKCQNGHSWVSAGYSRLNGHNCPYCVNQKVLSGFNDLATTHPELAKEAHRWDPKKVIAGTSKKMTWMCHLGHKWEAGGNNRALGGNCPYCMNKKVLKGFNDLATTHPELAKEAISQNVIHLTAGSSRKIKWKCQQNHIWSASVSHRVHGRGCPSCATSGFDPNKNGYIYFLIQPKWEMYQIGITNSPEDRLERHKKNGFELLELRGPIDGHTAQELETAMLRFLKSQKADLSPDHVAGKFDGYSESWTIDSFQVNNLKELIDKSREAGY